MAGRSPFILISSNSSPLSLRSNPWRGARGEQSGCCYPLGTADINVSVYAKFLMNGYVDEANYLEYPSNIKSLSYVVGKQHLSSFGLSVGIGF